MHSAKDLPAEDPEGIVVGAVPHRADPLDVLVTRGDPLGAGARVGTSSLRRRAQLLALRSDVEVVALRGNVPTRIRKVDEGQVHAAILAAAGVHRLGVSQRIACYLDAPDWLPAAGQGAIAVQIREDDERMRGLLLPLNNAEASLQTRAERAFLAALEGGCQVPIGALALERDGRLTLHGLIADISGRQVVRGEHPVDVENPELSGIRLANELRGRGASEILEGLRRAAQVPAPQPE